MNTICMNTICIVVFLHDGTDLRAAHRKGFSVMRFAGRNSELDNLEKQYGRDRFEICVLFGR